MICVRWLEIRLVRQPLRNIAVFDRVSLWLFGAFVGNKCSFYTELSNELAIVYFLSLENVFDAGPVVMKPVDLFARCVFLL